MSTTLIRRALPSDAETLAQMRYDFRTSFGGATETAREFVPRATAWMKERLRDGSAWCCWVAEIDGLIAGHIWLQLIEKVPNPVVELEKHGYITNVFVAEHARSHGIGNSLIQAALDHCRAEGIDSVVLWPTQRSRSLYARHGFAAPEDLFELKLDEGRAPH